MIHYQSGSKELIDQVMPLWLKLHEHHKTTSLHFKEFFSQDISHIRRGHFESVEHLKIILAYDSNQCIGYVVVSKNEKSIGEIESLFLDEAYRGQRIGHTLMEEALKWLEDSDCKKIILGTSVGNEKVWPFYEQFGFYPRTTILQRK